MFRRVSTQYRDIGAFTGLFIGSVLICLFPRLGLLFAVVAAGLTVLGYQLGKRKGDEADRIWQEVVNEAVPGRGRSQGQRHQRREQHPRSHRHAGCI